MGETEVRTAETSGTVTNASGQTSKPKSAAKSGARRGASVPKAKAAKLNERGVPVTVWDNSDNDPNKRKHVGESPDGEGNKLGKVPGE